MQIPNHVLLQGQFMLQHFLPLHSFTHCSTAFENSTVWFMMNFADYLSASEQKCSVFAPVAYLWYSLLLLFGMNFFQIFKKSTSWNYLYDLRSYPKAKTAPTKNILPIDSIVLKVVNILLLLQIEIAKVM